MWRIERWLWVLAITALAQLSYSTMTLDCQSFWFHHHPEDFEPFVDFPLCRDLLFGDVCILWPENQKNINHNHDHFHFELELNCIVFHLHYATFFMPLEAGRRPKRRNRNFFRLMFWLRWFILLTVMSILIISMRFRVVHWVLPGCLWRGGTLEQLW